MSEYVELPLSRHRIDMDLLIEGDRRSYLVHGLEIGRLGPLSRSTSEQWVSSVSGIRWEDSPVSVTFRRRTRILRRVRERSASTVYGANGIWAAEAVGQWHIVRVRHAGRTRDFAMPRARRRIDLCLVTKSRRTRELGEAHAVLSDPGRVDPDGSTRAP